MERPGFCFEPAAAILSFVPPSPDETELLAAARSGDRDAFSTLAEAQRDRLTRFVVVLCPEDADDLVAESIARAWESLDRFEGKSRFSTWLHGIALNLCRRARRDRARHAVPTEPHALDAEPTGRRGVLTSMMRRELAERLDLAIGRLPMAMREVFALRFVDAMTYDEIAEIVGVTVGTARVRAHRARSLLRGELGSVVDTMWRDEAESS